MPRARKLYKVHAIDRNPWHSRALCGTEGLASEDIERVTCLLCLWRLGHYVPLVKLAEHQCEQSAGRAAHGKRDPFYRMDRVHNCLGCGSELIDVGAEYLACSTAIALGGPCTS